jgi:hypothetical protein
MIDNSNWRTEMTTLKDECANLLAAKDAEIAELRGKLSMEKCELYDALGDAQETGEILGAWKQRAQQAESERDEARECVKRLCAIGESAKTFIGTFIGEQPKTGRSHYAGRLWDQLDAALAATPEQLR